ncbi:hypothetical protein WME95_01190 [Sorangium sp. So ce327]|uniref:LGFP repeat-containing protein n=1 Tax=Sorangium sp. So ce327 TaxID=3133301 RepID=UPI003F6267D9
MSKIDEKYLQLIEANPWIGAPVGDEQTCADKVGSFREYQGAASIYYTPNTGAHLIYGLIRAKWIALGREKGPNGYPTSDEIDSPSGLGRCNMFQHGTITWKRGTSEAFAVYGAIYAKWGTLQYDKGPLGFPLTDESATVVGAGRFNDFEHGAIYYSSSVGTHVVRSPILEAWTFADREKGLFKLPTSDTPTAKDAGGSYTQQFQGGSISCKEGASRSIVANPVISPRIEARTRSLVLAVNPKYADAWKKPGINDARTCKLTRLNRHFRLRTALVIFPGSYTRTLAGSDIDNVKSSYATAAAKIRDFNFGLAEVHPTVVVANTTLKKVDFTDKEFDQDPTTFQAEFNGYSKVIQALAEHGHSVADFDVVSICIPWMGTDTSKDKPASFAKANPVFKLNNAKTWTTIHHVYPGDYWWAFFVHEITHCVEWMLQNHGYPDLRNNDDPWWAASYPHLASSIVAPPPENVDAFSDTRLYAMHQRIKASWFGLAPTWGEIRTDTTSLENYGEILMYACPDGQAIVESAWGTKYLGISPSGADCQSIKSELDALYAERGALQAELSVAAPGQKPSLAGQIVAINQKINALGDKKAVCEARAALASK